MGDGRPEPSPSSRIGAKRLIEGRPRACRRMAISPYAYSISPGSHSTVPGKAIITAMTIRLSPTKGSAAR